MIVGNAYEFAIDSSITKAYRELGVRALGFFVLIIDSKEYGVRDNDATLLACSYDKIRRRLEMRGSHVLPSDRQRSAHVIASDFVEAVYPNSVDAEINVQYFDDIVSSGIIMAPDGDEAFDDGSIVLQYDADDQVRLIAFKTNQDGLLSDSSLRDKWMAASRFYSILEEWIRSFDAEHRSSLDYHDF